MTSYWRKVRLSIAVRTPTGISEKRQSAWSHWQRKSNKGREIRQILQKMGKFRMVLTMPQLRKLQKICVTAWNSTSGREWQSTAGLEVRLERELLETLAAEERTFS